MRQVRYEWIGIIGSILIIFAFTFKNEKKIRIFDAVGAMFFIIYGALIHAFATVFLNAVLICVHIWRMMPKKAQNKEINPAPEEI